MLCSGGKNFDLSSFISIYFLAPRFWPLLRVKIPIWAGNGLGNQATEMEKPRFWIQIGGNPKAGPLGV